MSFVALDNAKRKKLRDTKVGQWLRTSAPKVLDAVGDALPDSGVLGIVKNLVDLDNNVTHEQRVELHNLIIQLWGHTAVQANSTNPPSLRKSPEATHLVIDFLYRLQ